jgi:HSP20 family protein
MRPSFFAMEPFFQDWDRWMTESLPLAGAEAVTEGEWAPVVDVFEADDHYTLTAELPGMEKKDVHVTMEDHVLTLTGERRYEHEEKDEKCHRMERSYGTFSRSFSLPGAVKELAIEAKFKDGILTVVLPKSEERKPKAIDIH